MDAFVKKFFPNFDAPGLPFVQLEPGMINHTYMQGIFATKPPYVSQNKSFYSVQPMTMLGRTTADINTGSSSVDGLSKSYITPQGNINLNSIGDTVRSTMGGLQTDDIEMKMFSWCWRDNHTTLLVNALRYVLITKSIETSGDIDNKLPEFTDGKLRIDPNFGMRTTSDSNWDKNDWPGGTDSANYPEMARLTEWIPPQPDNPVLDLRGMNGVEARFIALMLGAWKSRSNIRLDFELPKLADNIYYRADADLTGLIGWLYQAETDQKPVIPTPPTSAIAWSALTKYVNSNRLYDHFSVALHIVTSLMYQMVPLTADGQIWLGYDWRVSLPSFASIRGRFTFLNEGDAAYGNHRALNEWSYIGKNLEVIHLMAMVFVQAIQTGLAIRSIRMATEDDPKDLFRSYLDFYMPFNMMSAAAAEAIRSPVPLPGMSGVCIEIQHDFDAYNADRRIPTLNDKDDDVETYETIVKNDILYVAAPWTTFAGVPTLLLPLNPFPYNSPFTLKGELNREMGRHQFRGFRVGAPNAWILTTIVGLAGYQIKAWGCSHACQAKEYHYIDMAKMTWPVLHGPDDVCIEVVLAEQDELGANRKCITLPHIDSKFFDQQVPYETAIMRRGISTSASRGRKLDVQECRGIRVSFEGVRLRYKVGEGVRASRAFITREEMHFRVVEINDAH